MVHLPKIAARTDVSGSCLCRGRFLPARESMCKAVNAFTLLSTGPGVGHSSTSASGVGTYIAAHRPREIAAPGGAHQSSVSRSSGHCATPLGDSAIAQPASRAAGCQRQIAVCEPNIRQPESHQKNAGATHWNKRALTLKDGDRRWTQCTGDGAGQIGRRLLSKAAGTSSVGVASLQNEVFR